MAELTLHGESARFAGGWHEVAADTHAYLQPNGGLGESNAGLVLDGDHALVVDSLWDNRLTGRMLDSMRELTDATPETLFNTHSDGDHVWGNQQFAGARIVSTAAAKRLMTLDPPRELRQMQRGGRLLGMLGSNPLPLIGTRDWFGLPRLPLKEMGHEMAPFDWSDIELTLPTETFDGELELAVGSRTVKLIEVGPAHTEGDAVAWVPDAAICFAADILFIGGTPIMWAGPVESWRRALDTISALGAERFVPGHGPVCTQREVDQLRDYFRWVAEEGVAQLERGSSPKRAAERMLFSSEFERSPWGEWDDPARLVATLCSEQHRRSGASGQLGGAGRSRAIVQMQLVKTALARRRAGSR
jgi:glyoxylase-like metal-dependent hydrolase (beta-lactamase superfamily II)